MSIAKYKVGETVYHWISGKITKVTITSCTIDDEEIDYTVTEQGKEKGRIFYEDQLFPTALDAAKKYKQYLLNKLSEYDKYREETVIELENLEKSYEC